MLPCGGQGDSSSKLCAQLQVEKAGTEYRGTLDFEGVEYDFVLQNNRNSAFITAAAIPVPKNALQKPFDLQGFKLMTVLHEHYDDELEDFHDEYHGAMICLADTELLPTSVEVIGPYEIENHQAECKRMKHLDALMPADTSDRLVSAFEMYTGCKPDVVPGFWL
ncbi:hypothetical protein CPB97_006978 [Podila verticillata]|nr:hypothetical protein CPB97_006978 [Podila verticillata]